MTATAELARFAAGPVDPPDLLRDLFLDHVGVAAAAAVRAESTPSVRAAVRCLDPAGGPATAIGEDRGYAPPYAALLNGCYAHSLDFDDTNTAQVGHPGASVIPAAMAEAERLGAGGRAFLAALAVGYEVACRVGAALGAESYDRGFHITAVSGIFGAVAAAGRLRGLDAATLAHAFGLAASKAAGSMQYLENGAWNKRLHPGFAAHDALLVTELAAAGVVGAADAIEGRRGLLAGYTGAPHPDALTRGLGTEWVLLETAIKPYPSCRLTHAAIDAALAVRERVPAGDRPGATIRVELPPTAMKIVGEPVPNKLAPAGTVDAQFSVYFQVAAAWLDGRVDWASYERIAAPDVRDLMARVSTTETAALGRHATVLTAEAGGRTVTEEVRVPLGEPGNPVGPAALRGKFLGLAEPAYGPGRAAAIADGVAGLADLDSVRDLIRLLRKDGR